MSNSVAVCLINCNVWAASDPTAVAMPGMWLVMAALFMFTERLRREGRG